MHVRNAIQQVIFVIIVYYFRFLLNLSSFWGSVQVTPGPHKFSEGLSGNYWCEINIIIIIMII